MDLSFIGSDLPPFGATPSVTTPAPNPSPTPDPNDSASLVRELLSHLNAGAPQKPPTPKLWRQILGGLGDALAARGAVSAGHAAAPMGAYQAGQRHTQDVYQAQLEKQREDEADLRRAAVVALINQGGRQNVARINAGGKGARTVVDPVTGEVIQLLADPEHPGRLVYDAVPQAPTPTAPSAQAPQPNAPPATPPATQPPPKKNLKLGVKQPPPKIVRGAQGYEPIDPRTGLNPITGQPVAAPLSEQDKTKGDAIIQLDNNIDAAEQLLTNLVKNGETFRTAKANAAHYLPQTIAEGFSGLDPFMAYEGLRQDIGAGLRPLVGVQNMRNLQEIDRILKNVATGGASPERIRQSFARVRSMRDAAKRSYLSTRPEIARYLEQQGSGAAPPAEESPALSPEVQDFLKRQGVEVK